MKFPIGFSFVRGFLTYEVISYNENSISPYVIQVGFSNDDKDLKTFEITESELEVSSNLGV